MHKVAILSYHGTALFELGCAVELFGLKRPEFPNWYSSDVITFEKGFLESTCGVTLGTKQISTLDPYTMLVIPSWFTSQTTLDENLKDEIVKFHGQSKVIISFCSGAFLLAELGLLNGQQATTHWRYADKFKASFPQVEYVDDVLYILNDRLACSAGSAAAIDLGLAVIRRDFGADIANKVARRLVMAPHRKGGQSQYIETPISKKSSIFDETLDWAMANLGSTITVDNLANRALMSRRTFDRRFRGSHGCSAKEWLIRHRVNLAKAILERSQYSIELVAQRSGFENANGLRHHFRKNLGVSPRQYRDQFSSLTNHLE